VSTTPPTVQAAGGVVTRNSADGGLEFLVVHRPRYDDWSLPKGKAEPGETAEQTALREVEEETGLACTLAEPAGAVRYVDHKGRPKIVRYWHMNPEPAAHPFAPNEEVDELRWCAPADAVRLLTYDHDRKLLRKAVRRRDGAPEPG